RRQYGSPRHIPNSRPGRIERRRGCDAVRVMMIAPTTTARMAVMRPMGMRRFFIATRSRTPSDDASATLARAARSSGPGAGVAPERLAHDQQVADVVERDQPDEHAVLEHGQRRAPALAHALERFLERLAGVGVLLVAAHRLRDLGLDAVLAQ